MMRNGEIEQLPPTHAAVSRGGARECLGGAIATVGRCKANFSEVFGIYRTLKTTFYLPPRKSQPPSENSWRHLCQLRTQEIVSNRDVVSEIDPQIVLGERCC